jgi:putative endonuclease
MPVSVKEQWQPTFPVTNSKLMNYVYILQNKRDGKFYTGSTNDLKGRLREHQSGNVKSTCNRRPLELIYYERCLNEDDAKQRENYLKSGMGKKYIRNRLKGYLENL